MNLFNTFFFLVFTLTSLLYWVPVFLIFFIPFIILRRIKRKIALLSLRIEEVSRKKLKEFKTFKKMIKAGRKMEAKTKGVYNKVVNKAYQKTVWWQRMEIIEAVPYGAKVLDIGCGNGYLAELIAKNKKAEVTGVDIDNLNQSSLPTLLFDGVNLPFADREFDVVILSFVLHHSGFQEELLAEAARVCRGEIIIFEDETAQGAEKFMGAVHEKIWNFLQDQEGKVNYRTSKGWQEMFARNNLEVLSQKREWGVGSLFIPLKKSIFVIKKKN